MDDCVLWTGARDKNGYGRKRDGKRVRLVHRLVYERHYGPIPDGLTVDHLCFQRSCVNPEHLRLLTLSENAVRHKEGCPCRVCRPVKKVHCHVGHPLTGTSDRDGSGQCIRCARIRKNRYMRRVRAAAA